MALRLTDADGTVHFSQLKKLALSGVKYLYACNTESEPTRDMLIGTGTHAILFGSRPGAKWVVRFDGDRRSGKLWEAFEEEHPKDQFETLTAPEWAEAEEMAAAVRRSPVGQRRLEGANFEVPLIWNDSGFRCSTSGIDIVTASGAIGDLKTTSTTYPYKFKRQALDMLWPQQLAFYRRGRLAHGLSVPEMFILGVERKGAREVVELRMTDALIEFADCSLSRWFEELRRNVLSIPNPESIYDWPGYAQAPVELDVPSWERGDDLDDEEMAA